MVRLVVEFFGAASDSRWPTVEHALQEVSAQSIRGPGDQPPHIVTALLPDDADLEAIAARLRSLDGVGRVEPDAMREAFGSM